MLGERQPKRDGIGSAHAVGVRAILVALTLLAVVKPSKMVGAQGIVGEFPFEFREGLLWAQVNLPQAKESLNFLVDTGAEVSVINLSTANRLQVKRGREVAVHGVGTILAGYWLERVSARAGDVQLPRKYLAVNLAELSDSCERRVDGLIGADFFRGRVVQIDFRAQKIRLLERARAAGSDETLLLELRHCGMRLPITVNGRKRQWVRLDTGCASGLQWVTGEVPPAGCTPKIAIGLAEVSIPQALATVEIGAAEFENVPTGLHQAAIFPGEAGLLGNALLSRFSVVTIDAKAGRLVLHRD